LLDRNDCLPRYTDRVRQRGLTQTARLLSKLSNAVRDWWGLRQETRPYRRKRMTWEPYSATPDTNKESKITLNMMLPLPLAT
jgi:hypothetical protein